MCLESIAKEAAREEMRIGSHTREIPPHLLTAVLTGSSSEKNISAVEVLAVPSAPTMSTAFRCLCSIRRRNSARVESIVGTKRLEKSRTSVLGYTHKGGRHLQRKNNRVKDDGGWEIDVECPWRGE